MNTDTGWDGAPRGADPLTRRLLRQMLAHRARPLPFGPSRPGEPSGDGEVPAGGGNLADDSLDSVTMMRLICAWHRRGVEVGFPELMARPAAAVRRR